MMKMRRRVATLLASFALLMVLPLASWAAEADDLLNEDDHNYVNERQMPDGSFLYDTSIEALASADAYYDGATVVVTGEVVGDRINAEIGSNSCWITLYSLRKATSEMYKPSSIQVYVSNSLADSIDMYGRYNVRGTRVQINGIFHLACVEHEGLSDIHATSLSVVQNGSSLKQSIEWSSFVPGVFAVAVGLILMLVYRRMKERAR